MAEQMNTLHFKRLLREYADTQKQVGSSGYPWLAKCECLEDNLLIWTVDMKFPEDAALQKGLEELAAIEFDETQNKLTLQVRFPFEYPYAPPEVWVRRPRFKHQSAPVTFGGKVCSPFLTSNGWESTMKMSAVIEQVRQALVDAGAEVDISVSKKTGYSIAPPAIGLSRLASAAIPQATDFRKPDVTIMSAAVAEAWVGDVSRLEFTDKIMLPFEWANEVYGAEHFQEGMMFEVKTKTGRKVHCALMDFVNGLPPNFVLMPKWVMDDVFIAERDSVSIRAVKLELCTYVKIQPHSVAFYDAVHESGLGAEFLLKESLGRFSGLTLDTSVPIEIGNDTFNVFIVDLQPAGAVKIISHDSFEAKVDFEPAPDLEDEQQKTEREKALMQRYRARLEADKAEQTSVDEKRQGLLRRRFARVQAAASTKVGTDDGSDGDVEIACRLPDGSSVRGKFRDGAPATALFALVLKSQWASKALPWGLQLSIAFPRKVLNEGDVLGIDVKNREMVNVRVEHPSEEEINNAIAREEAAEEEDAQLVVQHANPDEHEALLDEDKLLQETTAAFELQRLLRSGVDMVEARRRVSAGELLPPDAPVQTAPLLTRTASRRAQEAAAQSRRRAEEERQLAASRSDRETKILQVMSIAAVERAIAETYLEGTSWSVERTIDAIFSAS